MIPTLHPSIHSPIRTGDVGEGRSVGTGTSLGDRGAELDIKAEASGGWWKQPLQKHKVPEVSRERERERINNCKYIDDSKWFHLPTHSGEQCNSDHIHFKNKIGGGKPTKLQFDLEGETFILQSLDGSGGSGSDFSMCTI